MCPLKSPGHKRQADGCAERRRGSATDGATAALRLLRRHQPGGGVQALGKVSRCANWPVGLEFRVGPVTDRHWFDGHARARRAREIQLAPGSLVSLATLVSLARTKSQLFSKFSKLFFSKSKLFPNFSQIQTFSKLFQTDSKLFPNFSYFRSKLFPNFSKLNPNFFQTFSKFFPNCFQTFPQIQTFSKLFSKLFPNFFKLFPNYYKRPPNSNPILFQTFSKLFSNYYPNSVC